jgi:hypothetical protein
LLEDHLFHQSKRCPDCIQKHLLKMEALLEEAQTLDKKGEYSELLSTMLLALWCLQAYWVKRVREGESLCRYLGQMIRQIRKDLLPLCFDVSSAAFRVACAYQARSSSHSRCG